MYRLHLLQQNRSRRSFLKGAFASVVAGCSLPALAVPVKMSSAHARNELLHGAMEAGRVHRDDVAMVAGGTDTGRQRLVAAGGDHQVLGA